MLEKNFNHYFVSTWLQGSTDPFTFQLAEAAFGRFKRAFIDRRNDFLIFATTTGHTYALNFEYVQMAKFLVIPAEEEGEIVLDLSPEVTLHFLNRQPVVFQSQDPRELARIFMKIKQAHTREYLSFTDQESAEIQFFTTDLCLLETATQFVEEGFLAIHLAQKTSS